MNAPISIAYLSSIRVSDAPEGWFARVLKHNVSGHRYVPPSKPESVDKRTRKPKAPEPYSKKGFALARAHAHAQMPKRPRWNAEREAELPTRYGSLTRTSSPYAEVGTRDLRGETRETTYWYVRAKCDCGEGMRIERSTWASPTRGPKACKACARAAVRDLLRGGVRKVAGR